MTKKNEEKIDTKKDSTKKKESNKKILFEAVKDNPEKDYVIIGALTRAGLIKQYNHEEKVYGIEDLEPSITDEELNKIIKNYLGE